MKKVYFLTGALIAFVLCGQIYSRISLFDSYITEAKKMINPDLLLDELLKEVNLPFLADIQTHVTTLEELTKLSQIADLSKQLELVKNSTGEVQAQALQKAVAECLTVIPLIDYLFKKDSSGTGLITQALMTLNQPSVGESLAKMTESIDLVGDTSMLLLNMQPQDKTTDAHHTTPKPIDCGTLKGTEKSACKMAALDAKLKADEYARQKKAKTLQDELEEKQAKIDAHMAELNSKLAAKEIIIDPETRKKAQNLHPQKTDEKVWKEKESRIGKTSVAQRIASGAQLIDKASSLGTSFNKLNFEGLIAASKKVNAGELSYAKSGITDLLKDISTGLEEIMGKKDSFAILALRVIGTAQAVSLANRLVTTSKTITTFMHTIADVALLSHVMKNLPSSNVPIPTVVEPWPVTEGDLDFS